MENGDDVCLMRQLCIAKNAATGHVSPSTSSCGWQSAAIDGTRRQRRWHLNFLQRSAHRNVPPGVGHDGSPLLLVSCVSVQNKLEPCIIVTLLPAVEHAYETTSRAVFALIRKKIHEQL